MNPRPMSRREVVAALAAASAASWAHATSSTGSTDSAGAAATYSEDEMLKRATRFFGKGAEGLAKVIEKVFKDHGRPNAYIAGEEVSAAVGVGLRYGEGQLTMRSGGRTKVYWAGPSIGIDAGANASKVFTLAYSLPSAKAIFERFPGVDGSAYWVGGVGVNYQNRDGITLAPIRLGVGLRSGVNIGYLHYRAKKSLLPL